MSTSVANCRPLDPAYRHPGATSQDFVDVYMEAVVDAIVNSDRSLQQLPGPSEIGCQCSRLLGYKMLQIPEQQRVPNWKATVGTGTHLWLESAFDRYNLRNAESLGYQERFYIETKVSVGEVNGIEITGSCDLYDRVTATVVDHKTCGPTILEQRRKKGPGQQYRTQAHLYGRGWQRAGLPVSRVTIVFLPRNGELDDAYIWSEPYDEQVALDALQRLEGIDLTVKALGPAALELLPTNNHYCNTCNYLKRHSTNLMEGCPGDSESPVNKPQPSTKELLRSRG